MKINLHFTLVLMPEASHVYRKTPHELCVTDSVRSRILAFHTNTCPVNIKPDFRKFALRVFCFRRDCHYSAFLCFFAEEVEHVGTSRDSESAIDEVMHLKPDLVFLDIEMPNYTGLEFSKIIYQKGFQGKVVFVTAHSEYTIKAIRAKAFDYLIKPVELEELKEVISRYKKESMSTLNPDVVNYYGLSEKEVTLVELMTKGLTSEQIAEKMLLSRHTIDTHRRRILTKTGCRNAIELLNLLKS